MKEHLELIQIANEMMNRSRAVIMSYYNSGVSVEWKADSTPVTIADQKAEEVAREFVAQVMPEAGVVGEEFGVEGVKSGYNWVIDPIDGTKSFIRGVPLFGTLLALYKDDQPILGCIDLSALDQRLIACAGQGIRVNENLVKCSEVQKLQDSCILSGTINTFEESIYGNGFANLRRKAQIHRGWGDAFGYFQVACGRAEVMADPIVSVWDIAPMDVIFAEAGGRFTQLDGSVGQVGHALKTQNVALLKQEYNGLATNQKLGDEVRKFFL